MYVHSLQIENLRCFQSDKVKLQYPGRDQDAGPLLPNVNLLVGINGAGKTTVLEAIALGVLGEILPGSGFVPYHLVRALRRSPEKEEAVVAQIVTEFVLHGQDLKGARETERLTSEVLVRRIKTQEQIFPLGADAPLAFAELFDDESPAFFLVGYGATRFVLGASQFEPLPSQRKRRSFRYQRVAGLFEDH